MDHDDIVIGALFHGRHAQMMVNGVPMNAHTGERAHLPPRPQHHGRRAHATDPVLPEPPRPPVRPVAPPTVLEPRPTGLDTLNGFHWRAEDN